jgi:hypothetical protein
MPQPYVLGMTKQLKRLTSIWEEVRVVDINININFDPFSKTGVIVIHRLEDTDYFIELKVDGTMPVGEMITLLIEGENQYYKMGKGGECMACKTKAKAKKGKKK